MMTVANLTAALLVTTFALALLAGYQLARLVDAWQRMRRLARLDREIAALESEIRAIESDDAALVEIGCGQACCDSSADTQVFEAFEPAPEPTDVQAPSWLDAPTGLESDLDAEFARTFPRYRPTDVQRIDETPDVGIVAMLNSLRDGTATPDILHRIVTECCEDPWCSDDCW